MKQSKRNRASRTFSVKQLTAGVAIASIIGLGATVANANSWGPYGAMMGGQSGMGQGMMGQGMMGKGGMGQGNMGQGKMGHGRGMQSGQFVEGRLAFLKTELGITDSQQQIWDEFAGFMRTRAKTMQEQMQQRQAHWQQHMQQNTSDQKSMDHKPMNQAEQSPLEHMQKRITHMQKRTVRMQAGLEALTKLYSALTPEQQAKAKNLLGSHMM